ncbi:hypothetical protein PYCC9005_002467 [Savitreella phatthalungensis]
MKRSKSHEHQEQTFRSPLDAHQTARCDTRVPWSDEKSRARKAAKQEAVSMDQWLSEEDSFVLKQAKHRSLLRIRDGRPKVIDPLVANLVFAEPTTAGSQSDLMELLAEPNIHMTQPLNYIDALDAPSLQELSGMLQLFLKLETHKRSHLYWRHVKTLCQYRLEAPPQSKRMGVEAEILLNSKTREELQDFQDQMPTELSHFDKELDKQTGLLDHCAMRISRLELASMYRMVLRIVSKRNKKNPAKSGGPALEAQKSSNAVLSPSGGVMIPQIDPARTSLSASHSPSTKIMYDSSPRALDLFEQESRGTTQPSIA